MFANKNEKAFLPVSKPFFKHDLRIGEDAVASAPVFLEHSLTMYAEVPLIDMYRYDEAADDWFPAAEREDLRVSYLICRDEDVIMAVDVMDGEVPVEQRLHLPYLLCIQTTVLEMEQGQVDSIIEALEDLLTGEFRPRWRCSMYEFSDDLWDNLIDARLMEMHGRENELWPTEYGHSEGLVTIISKLNGSETVGRSTQYSDRVWKKLRQMFHDRDDYQGVRFLKQLREMPLETYMKEYSHFHEKLKGLLPESCHTYGQAAEAIHCVLQNPNGDHAEMGAVMMQALALPLFDQAMKRTREFDALLFEGMEEFARQLAESDERKRGEILRAERERRRTEWKDRMAALKKENHFLWTFLGLHLNEFFQGVGICAHPGYPDWLLRTVCDYHYAQLDEYSSYTEALCFAYETATSGVLDQEDGVRLLYQLTIEPFHLIQRKIKEVNRLCGD